MCTRAKGVTELGRDTHFMRLADFILANVEPILADWEAFARSIWPGAATDPATLRDDAESMLRAAVSDMKSNQTTAQQSAKAKGAGESGAGSRRIDMASTAHGAGRVGSGFDLAALIAEYRALRASVIRLWRESSPTPDLRDLDDLTRFNESIDQSLTESVVAFTRLVERERQAALDEQKRQDEALREMNQALLVSSVHQHELTEQAHGAEAALRQSEGALRRSERDLSDFFDNATVGLHWVGPDGIILRVNQAELDLLGYTREEYLGHHIAEFHVDQPVIEDILRRLADHETLHEYEARLLCKDGSIRDVLINSNVLWEGDCFVHTRCFTRDITERKAAENALRESELRYRTLFELGPVAVYSCNASGVIQHFNRRAAELWGRAPAHGVTDERFCGSFKMFRPDGTFMPHEQCPMADVLSGKIPEVRDGEVHIERPDSSRVVVIVTIRPMKNERGEITGAINCFYDITARKQAEEELREAKQSAENANRAKDTFLAVLSHELRTPLTPVLMAVAAMEFNPELPPALREDVKMIRRNVEMEAKLIDDLLDLSRITTGKLRLTFDILGINDLLRQACDTCRPLIHEKGIHLHCDLVESAGEVVGDPGRLQQVFWNLLNNAAKFTPEGGHIYVSAEHVGSVVSGPLSAVRGQSPEHSTTDNGQRTTDQSMVRVTVRDTGIGIAPEILPRIFDAFEQGEVRITRQFGGMGLGLAICKALVEQHRGSISANTAGRDRGSTFVVELPALTREQAAANAPGSARPGTDPGAQRLRLMVVEDHADTAKVLGKLLRTSGHTVATATTATAALALAAAETFDIVISDLGLPDMTGYELMKRIKEKYGTKGIAMSGYGMEEDMRKSEHAGFSDHLVKPVTLAQLQSSIRRVAAKRNGDPTR